MNVQLSRTKCFFLAHSKNMIVEIANVICNFLFDLSIWKTLFSETKLITYGNLDWFLVTQFSYFDQIATSLMSVKRLRVYDYFRFGWFFWKIICCVVICYTVKVSQTNSRRKCVIAKQQFVHSPYVCLLVWPECHELCHIKMLMTVSLKNYQESFKSFCLKSW